MLGCTAWTSTNIHSLQQALFNVKALDLRDLDVYKRALSKFPPTYTRRDSHTHRQLKLEWTGSLCAYAVATVCILHYVPVSETEPMAAGGLVPV